MDALTGNENIDSAEVKIDTIGSCAGLGLKYKTGHKLTTVPKHLNGDIACAIDTETTGLDPLVDSIWELAVVPLDHNWLPQKDAIPFYCLIQPRLPIERIDFKADVNIGNRSRILKAYADGFPCDVALDLFFEWFYKLDLMPAARIQPLGHNFSYDEAFMRMLWGDDTYRTQFSHKTRDTMKTEMFIEDTLAMAGNKVERKDYRLEAVARKYGVENTYAHNALADAITSAQIYSRQCRRVY